LRAELDKITPEQWAGLGRAMGGQSGQSGGVSRTGSADQMERNVQAGRTASGGPVGGQRRLAPDVAAEQAGWEQWARDWRAKANAAAAAEYERLTGMPWTGGFPEFNNGSQFRGTGDSTVTDATGTGMGGAGGQTPAGTVPAGTVPAGTVPAGTGNVTMGGLTTNPLVQEALNKLNETTGLASADIGTALAQQLTGLQSVDPMAQFRFNTGNVVIPNAPAAGYLDYIGGGTGGVEATRGLGQQLLNQALGNIAQYSQGVGNAAQNWRNAQQSIARNTADIAQRMLAMQSFANAQAIRNAELNRQTGIQDTLLNAILNFGKLQRSGSGGSYSVPQMPFNTITLPNYGTVTYNPSTLFGG